MNEVFGYDNLMQESLIRYPSDPLSLEEVGIGSYLLDIFTGEENLQTGEQVDVLLFAGEQISRFLQEQNIQLSDIDNIGEIATWYIVVTLKNGERYVFNLQSIEENYEAEQRGEAQNSSILEGTDLSEVFQEARETLHLAWGNFQDHIYAMEAIFERNEEEGFFSGNGFLDENDRFDPGSPMSSRIVNPELFEQFSMGICTEDGVFNGLTIYEIQQRARQQYRHLIELLGEYPIEILPPDTQDAIAQSIEIYTRMIMGIGDRYEGGATHFDKSESEVMYGIHFGIERLSDPESVIQHWLGIRQQISANNFQDTTVEQHAYPTYMRILNRLSYQKMIDLGASREELLRFARAVSGRGYSGPLRVNSLLDFDQEWEYGSDHNDHEFANVILGNLIGMPQEDSFNTRPEQEEGETPEISLIERLIQHNIMQDITDSEVPSPEDLTILKQRVESIFQRAGLEFPSYMNNNFFARRDAQEILVGSYDDLTLEQKISVSSLSRFISYLETSIGEYESPERYQDSLKQNARYISSYFGGMGMGQHEYLHFNEELNKYIIGVNPFGRGMIYIQVPLEDIQSLQTAQYYLQSLREIVHQDQLIPTGESGIYSTRQNQQETIGWESLASQIPPYPYGSQEDDIIPAFSVENFPEGYIENLRIRSISESFDYMSDTIMGKFDTFNWSESDNQFIDPQSLSVSLWISETDRDILELWTDINGLGEWHEWSDTNVDRAMTGLKIGLIIALTTIATSLTMGAAAGGFAAAARFGTGFVRYSLATSRMINATRGGSMIYGATMGFYAAPVSWVIYPHGYSSRTEMVTDLLSDVVVSTGTGALGGSLRPGLVNTIFDFTVLGLMTEAYRMKVIQEEFHPGENFLDEQEL